MNKLEQAARQALQVLKKARDTTYSDLLYVEIDSALNNLGTALEQPEQEPVAWFDPDDFTRTVSDPTEKEHAPLYTHPPRREWRGLTEEEIIALWLDHVVLVFGKHGINPILFARAIEAALKEKNHG